MGKQTPFKHYVFKIRNITLREAAKELGYSHKYIGSIANGSVAGGKLARKIFKWSKGNISINSLIDPLD
jgi:hypothetical protein